MKNDELILLFVTRHSSLVICIMKIYTLPIEMVNALRSWFHPKDRHIYLSDSQYIISRRVAWEMTISRFSNLPGRVGFWPMTDVQRSTGNAYDVSPQGRDLTYNGNPQFGLWDDIVPYIDLDGTGDFLSRADETDLDIAGTETIYVAGQRGLTLGGWFWHDTLGTNMGLIGKWNGTGNQRGYLINSQNGGVNFHTSSNGTATNDFGFSTTIVSNKWYFIVGKYEPGLRMSIFLNGVEESTTTSIPASIFNNTAAFQIGAFNAGTNVLNGRACLCFLCAQALPDDEIQMLYEQSKILFGYRE